MGVSIHAAGQKKLDPRVEQLLRLILQAQRASRRTANAIS
jgi:hypothetical protein